MRGCRFGSGTIQAILRRTLYRSRDVFEKTGAVVPKYDLVVVGAGLGGLAAAALAARMNRSVIVLEPGDTAGGALAPYRNNGFLFSPGPILSFGFERGGIFQRLNERLGIVQSSSLRSPCYQVALPDRRITVFSGQTDTLRELDREFPREKDRIRKFYETLSKQSVQNSKSRFSSFISRNRRAARLILGYGFSREFCAFLDIQSRSFFGVPAGSLSVGSLITLFDSSPLLVPGGFQNMIDQMVNVILKNGGEIKYQVPTGDIGISSRSVTTPLGVIDARAVLLNMEQQQAGQALFMGIREEVLPVGMVEEVLFIPVYEHPERFIRISVSSGDDETAAPRGMRTLTATFQDRDGAGSVAERIQQVSDLIPFLTEFTVFTGEYPHERRTTPLPGTLSLKSVRTKDQSGILNRTLIKGVFVLFDGRGTPAQSVAAAQLFMKYIE